MYAIKISQFELKGTKDKIIISDIFGTETAKKGKNARFYGKWKESGEQEFLQLIDSNKELNNIQKKEAKK